MWCCPYVTRLVGHSVVFLAVTVHSVFSLLPCAGSLCVDFSEGDKLCVVFLMVRGGARVSDLPFLA